MEVRMHESHTAYMDSAALAEIGSLEMRARMIVEGVMAGMHRSPYHGFSVEFAQHRPYAPGDDIRHLDWKVYGRTDKLYLKQYQQETNLDLIVLVDASGSMAYTSGLPSGGRWRKYDYAATLAASLAYLALRQQDRVGLVLFADTVLSTSRVTSAHGHWRSLIESLSSQVLESSQSPVTEGGRTTDLGRLFEQVLAKTNQRSLVTLISDLFDDPDSLESGLARANHRGHDVMVLQVLDPAERSFPFRSAADFIGLEGEGRLGIEPAALRRAYLEALADHLHRVQQVTRRFQFDHMLLDSLQPMSAPLSHFLARRTAATRKPR